MNLLAINKWALLGIVLLVTVWSDYATKRWAEDNLASRSSRWDFHFERTVEPHQDALSVDDWIASEFNLDPIEDAPLTQYVGGIYRVTDPVQGTTDGPLRGFDTVLAGQTLQVHHRRMVIVEGFWNMVYVQNFGAAWGIFGERDESFRKPFFFGVSILAICLVLFIYRGLRNEERMMQWALAVIVGGAIGNFIDRVQYGYVVDFVDWYITWNGQEKHWPTFNVADVWLVVGMGLMAIQILFYKEPEQEAAPISLAAAPTDAGATDDETPQQAS